MKLPVIKGLIDRRMLINFTADPQVVAHILPAPFKPKIYEGKAIVGICLIRLKNIRLQGFPAFIGIASENAAHRFAVEWEEDGEVKEGVYIPRRDTSLWLNALAGGRIFPGKHYRARFNVQEANGNYHLDFTSSDDTYISIDATATDQFNTQSVFGSLHNASCFFEQGSVGYSPKGKTFQGMRLQTNAWKVSPLQVTSVRSSFFENEALFPNGSLQFDNALVMHNIAHEWHSEKELG